MTQSSIIQATLLYDGAPDLAQEALRADFRALAGQHNLPISGGADTQGGRFRITALPFEITLQASDAALPAATFNGALASNLAARHHEPLGKVVAEHTAHLRIAVRDTGETACRSDVAQEAGRITPEATRRAVVLAQDAVRLVMQHLPPMAVHWHPSNQLALPTGLAQSRPGRIYLPLCLGMRCTSATIGDTAVVNMAQEITGAEDLLGKPLHIMSTTLGRIESMQLAIAFLERMLEGEARPIAGAVFRDQKGTRAEVVDKPADRDLPGGLIALVEIDDARDAPRPGVSVAVQGSREVVAARAEADRAARPGITDRSLRKIKPRRPVTLTQEQTDALRAGLAASDEAAASTTLPRAQRLHDLRLRTAANPRNSSR